MHVICSCHTVWWMLQARVIHHSLCDSSPCYMDWSHGFVLVWNTFCKEKSISISLNEATRYTTKIQKTHLVFANIAEFSHRNCVLVSHWLSTVVMTLRCCQHKSTPHGHCREDDTVERRSHDLWPCSVDSVWLLSTAELSCVDTKWLSYSDRQWEKQERGSVLSGQHRKSATQSDNRENTFTWDKLPRPWPPTISFPLLRYFLWTKKKKTVQKWQVWICRPLCWNEVGRNSSSGREEKVPLSGQIRFEGWRAAFCEFELQRKLLQENFSFH